MVLATLLAVPCEVLTARVSDVPYPSARGVAKKPTLLHSQSREPSPVAPANLAIPKNLSIAIVKEVAHPLVERLNDVVCGSRAACFRKDAENWQPIFPYGQN
jgi:hypothetical protein